jgi:hypothetical protein
MLRDTWAKGENLFECDRCGRTYYISQSRTEWNGLLVCHGPGTSHCWEPRQPQEYVRSAGDRSAPHYIREQDTSTEVAASCTLSGRAGKAGYGVAGCMITGLNIEIPESFVA